jgi:hypothetical protein
MFPTGYPLIPFVICFAVLACEWSLFGRSDKGKGNMCSSTQVTFCFGIEEKKYVYGTR